MRCSTSGILQSAAKASYRLFYFEFYPVLAILTLWTLACRTIIFFYLEIFLRFYLSSHLGSFLTSKAEAVSIYLGSYDVEKTHIHGNEYGDFHRALTMWTHMEFSCLERAP